MNGGYRPPPNLALLVGGATTYLLLLEAQRAGAVDGLVSGGGDEECDHNIAVVGRSAVGAQQSCAACRRQRNSWDGT
jgi:hypothetical protein